MTSYNSQRTRNLYSSSGDKPFKLSRSKIQDFLNCPRCFYLDRKCGTGKPGGLPFTLNMAVDRLLKNEFDGYRMKGAPHPLMVDHNIDAVPFAHPDLDEWRMNFKGIQTLHSPTGLLITGSIDDLWMDSSGRLIVVDYKATSTSKQITLDEEYRKSYKNQMEIYQWLLRRKGFQVSNTGYFVYCNGDDSKSSFEGNLKFSISLLPYTGDDSWFEPTLFKIRECLDSSACPMHTDTCDFCNYVSAVNKHLQIQE